MKTQAFNPFLPSYEYIPDGEPYVFGNRIYIYGSHDAFNGSDYCVNNYVCWSASVDHLGDWKYEGVIYDKQKDPLCDDVKKRLLFAPDVQLGTDGRYYLYYAFDELSIMSVAVCDTPAGEYEFYGHVHYADGTLLGKKMMISSSLTRAYTGKETMSTCTPASARLPDAGNQREPIMTESKVPSSWNWKQICLQSEQSQKLSHLVS